MNTTDDRIDKRLRNIIWIIIVVLSALAGIEARISRAVTSEEIERKAADIAIEERFERQQNRIEKKLDSIEKYIREQ